MDEYPPKYPEREAAQLVAALLALRDALVNAACELESYRFEHDTAQRDAAAQLASLWIANAKMGPAPSRTDQGPHLS
ncbi:MAG: hypothetical protein K9K38_04510 [Rhodoferax sp.]|nr:hypothetical protein [Rhodoferax sp.]MCF8208655.1 hypothetical protein [Rhodoferax sp.]